MGDTLFEAEGKGGGVLILQCTLWYILTKKRDLGCGCTTVTHFLLFLLDIFVLLGFRCELFSRL